MAGHSKFKKIKHHKSAQDKKRGDVFTKALRAIVIAAKSGLPDPNLNTRLRVAIATATNNNVPKDKIRALLQKITSRSADQEEFDEIRYEGRLPGGVLIIVETLTDNRNRSAADIRSLFVKYGGSLETTGSVSYLFQHLGVIEYYPSSFPVKIDDKQSNNSEYQISQTQTAKVKHSSNVNSSQSFDKLLDFCINLDIEDCTNNSENDNKYQILTKYSAYNDVYSALAEKFGEPASASLIWSPLSPINLDSHHLLTLKKLLDALEQLDDVQATFTNVETEVDEESI